MDIKKLKAGKILVVPRKINVLGEEWAIKFLDKSKLNKGNRGQCDNNTQEILVRLEDKNKTHVLFHEICHMRRFCQGEEHNEGEVVRESAFWSQIHTLFINALLKEIKRLEKKTKGKCKGAKKK